MLYLTQPIPDPTEGAALIDRTDLNECTCMRPVPNPAQLGVTESYAERLSMTPMRRASLFGRRRAAGITIEEASYHVGKSHSYVRHLESGVIRTIHPDVYRDLLDLYASVNERMAS